MKVILLSSLLILSACADTPKHKVASIPEASGISYCQNSGSLVVADDEGSLYEINPQGAILRQHKLGEYDLEGVVCQEKKFMFAVEDGKLLEVDRKTLKSKLLKIKGQDFEFSKKSGIEGITKIKDLYYVSIQAKTKKDSKILVLKVGKKYAKVVKTIEHGIIDSAGMQYHNKKIYIVSDKKDKLYIYNLKKNRVKKKIKLDKFAQEGITFDNKDNVYFADDNGAVMKYSLKELGI